MPATVGTSASEGMFAITGPPAIAETPATVGRHAIEGI
jgi:hypothetical protein